MVCTVHTLLLPYCLAIPIPTSSLQHSIISRHQYGFPLQPALPLTFLTMAFLSSPVGKPFSPLYLYCDVCNPFTRCFLFYIATAFSGLFVLYFLFNKEYNHQPLKMFDSYTFMYILTFSFQGVTRYPFHKCTF